MVFVVLGQRKLDKFINIMGNDTKVRAGVGHAGDFVQDTRHGIVGDLRGDLQFSLGDGHAGFHQHAALAILEPRPFEVIVEWGRNSRPKVHGGQRIHWVGNAAHPKPSLVPITGKYL